MTNRTRLVLIHIICSSAFLLLPFFPGQGEQTFAERLQDNGALRDFSGYVFALLFFYINYFLLIPRLYFKRKYLWYLLTILVCFIFLVNHPNFFSGAPPPKPPEQFENPAFNNPPKRPNSGLLGGVQHNLFRFSLAFFISLFLKINERWRQTEEEKTQAELSFLKAQVNPHFLFNTLNGIYALALDKSDSTPDAIAKLSGMMRYITSQSGNDRVPLEKELEYLSNYIELQKIRFDNTVQLEYKLNYTNKGQKIAPLILITFIENAFKYGVNPEEESAIKISIDIHDNILKLFVENKIVQVQPAKVAATSLGIDNTRDRLEYMYPDRHKLSIEEKDKHFYVSLEINL